MRISLKTILSAGALALLTLITKNSGDTQAMPMFTRKLGVSCATCHNSQPRLNETGYRFRAAGFRWPEMIGEESEEPFDPLNYNSVRVQMRYTVGRAETGSVVSTTRETNSAATELYLFTGAWRRHFSTASKVTLAPGKTSENIENAYVKFNADSGKSFFSSRAGLFHPYDGFGASDTPATVSRPLIQTTPANFDQNTFFRTWGFDQLGVEVGLDYRRTLIRAAVLNGIVVHQNKDGGFAAFAAQGGALTPSSPLPGHAAPDFQFFINHRMHPEGRGVSLHYYHGNVALPIAATDKSSRNKFDRTAIYGSYPLLSRLNLLGGYQYGRDRAATAGRFTNGGGFVEASVPLRELTIAGVRYD